MSMRIYLENGESLILAKEASSGFDLAKKLKKEAKLRGAPLVLRRNGRLLDLSQSLRDGDKAAILGFDDAEGRKVFWHSSAHLLAQAVLRFFPEAQPSIGPAIEEGFFYDFGCLRLHEKDLEKIESEARNIIKERLIPERIEFAREEDAKQAFAKNPFKLELIQGKEETLSAYRQGEFLDLCAGPHIPHFGLIQGFKLLKTSGSYWRGDSQKEQLTRIYGISFPEKKMLTAYLHRIEEARKRDHRILAKRLDLFSFHEEAPGMPFFHPRGMLIWEELLSFMRSLHAKHAYVEIKSPVMLSRELWERSGHWLHYRDNMYTARVDDKDFAIKPMNCPGCLLYYKKGQYSYRQLPLRIAEIGHVHRHEMSGALSGLLRVRCFHQDDAHIFMQTSDIEGEVLAVLHLAQEVYECFGLDFHLELSTRPAKSIGSDEQWSSSTQALHAAVIKSAHEYKINEGDGAFYGPKIDFHIKDAIGRTWQCGTIQLDMSLPERFDLVYESSAGAKERPVMIHRAIYGSMERFFAILLEHYAGRFPLWLSPVQLRFVTVAERHMELASALVQESQAAGLRVDIDNSMETVSKKIRTAQLAQVNYIIVVGDKEEKLRKYTVRSRQGQVFPDKEVQEILSVLQKEKSERSQMSLF